MRVALLKLPVSMRLVPCGVLLSLLGLWSRNVLAASASADAIDVSLFEDSYCEVVDGGEGRPSEINIGSMTCSSLMEFVYIVRRKAKEKVDGLAEEARSGGAVEWTAALQRTSRAASVMSAHVHMITAMALQRAECFSEHMRLLLTANLRRLKQLAEGRMELLWMVVQQGPERATPKLFEQEQSWLAEATLLLESDLQTMAGVLKHWHMPDAEESSFFSHEADGRFSTIEALRRDTFNEWQVDVPMMQSAIQNVFPANCTVADLGAGSGHYAKWLNESGHVTAFAYDGSPEIEFFTKGLVRKANLAEPMDLGRTFEWGLCLEVAEHIPPEQAPVFLHNIDKHVTQGLIMSWAQRGFASMGFANPKTDVEVAALFKQHTSLQIDEDLTNMMRAASTLSSLSPNLLVFKKVADPLVGGLA